MATDVAQDQLLQKKREYQDFIEDEVPLVTARASLLFRGERRALVSGTGRTPTRRGVRN